MKTSLLVATTLAGITTAATAHAGARLGAEVLLSPLGTATVSADTGDEDDKFEFDLGVSYGIGGLAAVDVSPYFSIGFAPRVLFGIVPDDLGDDEEDESLTELDLAVRFTGHIPLGHGGAQLQLHASPGYSFLFLPEEDEGDDEVPTPSGLIIGIGAAVAIPVSPTVSLVGDLGYNFGFQSYSIEGFGEELDVNLHIDTLRLGFGVQATI